MKKEQIILSLPSGKEVEILSENEYFIKYMNTHSVARPHDYDHNNQTYFLLKDNSLYSSLTEEDKIFVLDSKFKNYTTLYKLNE